MSDSITKYNHKMVAEESIQNFIGYLESEGESISKTHKEWLFEKGNEVFEAYYIDNHIQVNLSSEEDKETIEKYFKQVQEKLGRMFAHIMLVEYRLFIIMG
jgi:hypothetical protein